MSGSIRSSMRAASVLGALLLLVAALAACSDPAAQHPASGSPPSQNPSPTGGPPAAHRESTVVVDWQAPGERWATVLRMPLGAGRSELGIRRYRGQEPILPSAIAVTPDGFVIMDPAHRRVLLVDEDGRVRDRWAGIAEQASDLVWDPAHQRLVIINNEARGELAELGPHGKVTMATAGAPVFRLTATETEVVAQGASDSEAMTDVYRVVPSPMGVPGQPSRDLGLPGGDRLSVEPLSADGGVWDLGRASRWKLRLAFVGRRGPREVIAPLREDLSFDGSRLVIATVAGSYASDVSLSRPLLVTEIDLETGRLLSSRQVSTCGLRQDANVVSYVAAYQGATYQLCLSDDALEIRRRPS